MDQIQHKFIEVQGLKLHAADIGSGPNAVVFLHGFPEIWYSWRHQMVAMAEAGFHALVPDFRGYGLSDPLLEPEKASFAALLKDLGALLDALGFDKVFLVSEDFGAVPAYLFSLLHQERVRGVVSLGIPHRSPSYPLTYIMSISPKAFTFQDGRYAASVAGRAEADFGCLDAKTVVRDIYAKTVVRDIYILFSRSEIPIAAENQEIMNIVNPSTPLPPWFTEGDLEEYGSLNRKSGFRTALKVPYSFLCCVLTPELWSFVMASAKDEKQTIVIGYESLKEDHGITDYIIKVPALLVMGEKDYVFKFAGMEEYIGSGKLKEFVPQLEVAFSPGGTHFIQEQSPDEANQLILDSLEAYLMNTNGRL